MMCVKLIEYTQSGNNLFRTDGRKWQLHGPLTDIDWHPLHISLIQIHFSVDFMGTTKRIWSLILLIDIIKP